MSDSLEVGGTETEDAVGVDNECVDGGFEEDVQRAELAVACAGVECYNASGSAVADSDGGAGSGYSWVEDESWLPLFAH